MNDGAPRPLLSDIATVAPGHTPGQVSHFNSQRTVSVTANVAGSDLGAAAREVERALGFAPTRETHALDLLRRPGLGYADLARVEGIGAGIDDAQVIEQIEVQARYAGYLERQHGEIERQHRNEETAIPERFDFAGISGLSAEVLAKLLAVQPRTIGQAMRISGVTPAAISLLLVHLKRGGRRVA